MASLEWKPTGKTLLNEALKAVELAEKLNNQSKKVLWSGRPYAAYEECNEAWKAAELAEEVNDQSKKVLSAANVLCSMFLFETDKKVANIKTMSAMNFPPPLVFSKAAKFLFESDNKVANTKTMPAMNLPPPFFFSKHQQAIVYYCPICPNKLIQPSHAAQHNNSKRHIKLKNMAKKQKQGRALSASNPSQAAAALGAVEKEGKSKKNEKIVSCPLNSNLDPTCKPCIPKKEHEKNSKDTNGNQVTEHHHQEDVKSGLVFQRLRQLLAGRQHGLFAPQMETMYKRQWGKQLWQDWLVDLEAEGEIQVERETATPVVKLRPAANAVTIDTVACQEEQIVNTTTEGGLAVKKEPTAVPADTASPVGGRTEPRKMWVKVCGSKWVKLKPAADTVDTVASQEGQIVERTTEAGPGLGSQARRWLAKLLRPSLAGLLVSDIEALYTKQRGQRLVSGWLEQLERESQVQVERPLLLVKWRQHTEQRNCNDCHDGCMDGC